MKDRPKLLPITEQMKEWSAHLDREISSWPGVVRKPMFGMISFYRDGHIFAAIPRTKSFEPEDSVAFKLYAVSPSLKRLISKEDRITYSLGKKAGWITFEIREPSDLKVALSWMEKAYESAKSAIRSKTQKTHR